MTGLRPRPLRRPRMPGFQAFRSNGARGRRADVLFTVGTERRGKNDPCHKRRYAAFAANKNPKIAVMQGFSIGGTGLEPVTPSLSIRGGRSRQFAGVRADGMVERNPSGERTVERTRTNVERCHCCHAESTARDACVASGEQLTQPGVVTFEEGVMAAGEKDEALLEVDDVLPDVEEERALAGNRDSSYRPILRHRARDEVDSLAG